METAETMDALVQTYRDLRVLPDRAADGDLVGAAYAAEWTRLTQLSEDLARGLSRDELRQAHERAKYAC